MSTTRKPDLASALFGKTRRSVLALFFSAPDASFYHRQVVREAGGGQGAVQRELQHLAQVGILERSVRGRQVHYQANRATPIFAELQELLLKTAGLTDVLRVALAPFGGKVTRAFVYGSQAAGTTTSGSDVNLLLVGDLEELALHRAIRQAEARLGRAVNYSLLTPAEFDRRKRARGGLLARVLRGPKIPILVEAHGA